MGRPGMWLAIRTGMRCFALLTASLATACGAAGDSSPPDAAPPLPDAAGASGCPGNVRPSIDDCFVGAHFAECGGTGAEPMLGCDVAASPDVCRWFSGGCVAAEYEASPC